MTQLESTLIAAVVGAVVGAVFGGLVTAWITRNQLTRQSRVQLYLEVIPQFQAHLAAQQEMVNAGKSMSRPDTLHGHWLLLQRMATVASKADRSRVADMGQFIDELVRIDHEVWGPDKHAYGLTVPTDLADVAASAEEPLQELNRALDGYAEWLSDRLN